MRKVIGGSQIFVVLTIMFARSAQAGLFDRSTRRDVEQGTEVAKQVEQQFGLYSHPDAEEYLREVGGRLVAVVNDARWKFSFQIVDQEEANAFSIPGGGVYVSRGLLALIVREDELACVLAHEIAHVTRRHLAHEQRKGILPALLSVPGNLVGGVVSEDLGSLINVPIAAVGAARLGRYSREQESEADRIGIRTAAEAGYDPRALAEILVRIDRDVASKSGQERSFSIFDSHPMTDTRLKDIRKQGVAVTPATKSRVAPDAASLFAKLDGIWWGENPEQGVFRKDQFLQPAVGFTLTLPTGWKHRNTPQYVISAHPKEEAMLLLGLAGPATDPNAVGEKFIERMRSKAQIEPVTTRNSSLGKFPAFVVTYLDRSGRTPVYLHFAWVAMAGKMYQLIGLAPERHQEALRNSALNLRPLTEAERGTVTGKRLRAAAANRGERLENLAARVGNAWSPAYTALVNALDAEGSLNEGQFVKIARMEPWTQASGVGQ